MSADPRGKPLALGWALLPLATLVLCFALGVLRFGFSAEMLIASMLAAAAVAGAVAARRGAGWEAVQRAAGEKLAAVLPVVLILLAIGMLIGTWVLAGTIPLLVTWGVRLVDPGYFVLTAFVVTAAMSLFTGTSWGSAGTLGVALMGAAAALDAPLAATAGAVVSGAYFGDKMSPLSDSTNICALGAGSDLYAHIRHMLYTAVPSFLLATAVYAVVGSRSQAAMTPAAASLPPAAERLLAEIAAVFRLDAWALLPLLLVLAGVALKRPPALVLAASAVLAATLGIVIQGFGIEEGVAAAISGFDVSMTLGRVAEPVGLSDLFVRLVEPRRALLDGQHADRHHCRLPACRRPRGVRRSGAHSRCPPVGGALGVRLDRRHDGGGRHDDLVDQSRRRHRPDRRRHVPAGVPRAPVGARESLALARRLGDHRGAACCRGRFPRSSWRPLSACRRSSTRRGRSSVSAGRSSRWSTRPPSRGREWGSGASTRTGASPGHRARSPAGTECSGAPAQRPRQAGRPAAALDGDLRAGELGDLDAGALEPRVVRGLPLARRQARGARARLLQPRVSNSSSGTSTSSKPRSSRVWRKGTGMSGE